MIACGVFAARWTAGRTGRAGRGGEFFHRCRLWQPKGVDRGRRLEYVPARFRQAV